MTENWKNRKMRGNGRMAGMGKRVGMRSAGGEILWVEMDLMGDVIWGNKMGN
jgi:hypothetical protein